jgi:hypothetical protein
MIDIPDEIYSLTSKLAIAEVRNVSQQIIVLLREALKARGIEIPPPMATETSVAREPRQPREDMLTEDPI